VRQLDRPAEPDEQVTPDDAKDSERVARMLMRLLKDVSTLRRSWAPRFVDHEDRVVDATGTTTYRFPHGFGGRVRWWPVDWKDASAGPQLERHSDTDSNTLVLVSYAAGTLTLRIEEAG
jgi:hypothetical protein